MKIAFETESSWPVPPAEVMQWASRELELGYKFILYIDPDPRDEKSEKCYILQNGREYVRIFLKNIDGNVQVGCKQMPEYPRYCARCDELLRAENLVGSMAICKTCLRPDDSPPLSNHYWGWDFYSGYSGMAQ
jgi:hypothetical protein